MYWKIDTWCLFTKETESYWWNWMPSEQQKNPITQWRLSESPKHLYYTGPKYHKKWSIFRGGGARQILCQRIKNHLFLLLGLAKAQHNCTCNKHAICISGLKVWTVIKIIVFFNNKKIYFYKSGFESCQRYLSRLVHTFTLKIQKFNSLSHMIKVAKMVTQPSRKWKGFSNGKKYHCGFENDK